MRHSRPSTWLLGTLLALAAGAPTACAPTVGGECDEEASWQVVYDEHGSPMYAGQALLASSCGGASQCHTQTPGAPRWGAPGNLVFDVQPLSSSAPDEQEESRRLLLAGASTYRNRDLVYGAVQDGSMPPAGRAPVPDLREAAGAYRSYAGPDDVTGTPLPSVGSPAGREILRNWLACRAPVVERFFPSAYASPCTENSQCELTRQCDLGTGECRPVGDAVPRASWAGTVEIALERLPAEPVGDEVERFLVRVRRSSGPITGPLRVTHEVWRRYRVMEGDRLVTRTQAEPDALRVPRDDCAEQSLGPGDECTLELHFLGGSEGQYHLLLEVHDADALVTLFNYTLDAPISLSPSEHDFGTDETTGRLEHAGALTLDISGFPEPTSFEVVAVARDAGGAVHTARVEGQSVDDPEREALRAECEAAGGDWSPHGMAQVESCDRPTRDAGVRCTSEADCEGPCIQAGTEALTAPPPAGVAVPACGDGGQVRLVVGRCHDRSLRFGCHPLLEHVTLECVVPGRARRRTLQCVD